MSSVSLNTTSSLLITNTQSKTALAKELKQLEQDISSGDLDAAQQDYVTLQSALPSSTGTSSVNSSTSAVGTSQSSTLDQLFTQLGKDLKSGDLSAAKQDLSQIKTALQNGPQGPPPGGPPSTDGDSSIDGTSSTTETALEKLLKQLELAITNGDTTTATATLTTLQKDLSVGSIAGASSTTGTNVNTYA